MCLAIYKPSGVRIPEEYIHTAYDSNPHGAGIAIDRGRRVDVIKGLWHPDDVVHELSRLDSKSCAIHFRYATHGKISTENCHPFVVSRKVALIHNGIIPGYGSRYRSDTAHYVDDVVKSIDTTSLLSSWHPGDSIGGSKLVILGTRGQRNIVNEQLGHWHNGAWYSNRTYEPTTLDYYYDYKLTSDELDDAYDDLQSWEDYCSYRDTERDLIRRILR